MHNALIIVGGWAGHEPEACAEIVKDWLQKDGFSVRIESDPECLADPAIHELSLIVPCITMGQMTRDTAIHFSKAVEGGVGLAGFHGQMGDSFRSVTEYQFMVGGQFVAHPGNIIDYTVNVTKGDDPIMAGITDFPYRSEQYYMHVDPVNEVLATTTYDGEHCAWIKGVEMPVVWKRMHGAGRVFYSGLGHVAAEFEHPQMATILRRGLNWAAR